MVSKEFHQLNEGFFGKHLSAGYKKNGSSTWITSLTSDLKMEFALRLDRDGWNEIFGSSFIYEVRPIYKSKYVYTQVVQLRLYELKDYDHDLFEKAERILAIFSRKVKSYEGCDNDDYYILLKAPWNREKIKKHAGGWYYFYDSDDLHGWHEATLQALLQAINAVSLKFINYDFEQAIKRVGKPTKARMVINRETGKAEVIEES